MTDGTQLTELEAAISSGQPFGPVSPDDPLLEVPAQTLRQALLAQSDARDKSLRLHRVRVAGDLDLEAQTISPRLLAESCEFTGHINLRQASCNDMTFGECRLEEGLTANQLTVRHNFVLNRSVVKGGLFALSAEVRGWLSVIESELEASLDANHGHGSALMADRISVGQSFVGTSLKAKGEIRLAGATIGGQLRLDEAELSPGSRGDGNAPRPCLGVSGIKVGGNASLNGLSAEGEMQLIGVQIGGQLSLAGATLAAIAEKTGRMGMALCADGAEIRGDLHCDRLSARGEVRLIGARIEGQTSWEAASLEAIADERGFSSPALTADRMEVSESAFFSGEFGAKGEMRFHGATVGGQLKLSGATLVCVTQHDRTPSPALNIDRTTVAGNLLCGDGFTAIGEVRIVGAKIGGQLSLDGALLKATAGMDGAVRPALVADGTEIALSMICDGLSAIGGIKMVGAKIGGQLLLEGVSLRSETPIVAELMLVGTEIDELRIGFEQLDGLLDLRSVRVRSLWDAEHGQFLGRPPDRMRLDGFRYESLREALDAKHRLRWVSASQDERHYPDVYAQLAEAFRRIGRRNDARKVGIANERRARRDLRRWSPRRAWHDLLWITVGYGYRNWLALIWILIAVGIGSGVFALNESAFAPASVLAPPFAPVLYAVDATIPILDLGQTRWWSATGSMAWVALGLAIVGYTLVAAVIAAAAGLFNRDQV